MECLVGGIFLAVLGFGFALWLGSAIQSAQTAAAPAPHRDYGGARTVRSTPRQRETATRVKASDRAITSARKQAVKGTPRGTVQIAPLGRAVDYEGRKVTAMYLAEDGTVLGYGDLADHPLDWE